MESIKLSTLEHTWLLDLDGTLVKHNGYIDDGIDTFLPGAELFLKSIPEDDMVIFLTSRKKKYREITELFLMQHDIRYNQIIYNVPYGERVLINDKKPSGLNTAMCISLNRNEGISFKIEYDETM